MARTMTAARDLAVKEMKNICLEELRSMVDKEIVHALNANVPQNFRKIICDYFERGRGRRCFLRKRLRPIACLLAFETCGGSNIGKIMPVAIAIEMVHNFTLIHDDIEDDSVLRKGKLALHKIYGVPFATNAGDAVFAMAFKHALSAALSNKQQVQLANCISRTVFRICEGQHMDIALAYSNMRYINETDYFEMVLKKSGMLTGALEAGVIAASSSKKNLNALCEFGACMGVAGQICDDIIDLRGSDGKCGKEIGGDIQSGQRTLPLIRTLKVASPADRRKLCKIYEMPKSKKGEREVQSVIDLIAKYGAIDYAKEKAKERFDTGRSVLERTFPKSESKEKLLELLSRQVVGDGLI